MSYALMLSTAEKVVKAGLIPYICAMPKRYWLMKSEPDVYSIDHLKKDKRTLWTGVRNYQARNFMMNEMSVGDEVLFYHSNAEPPGIVGIARVSRGAIPDPEQFDPKSEYHDPKAAEDRPIWFCVEVEYKKHLPAALPLPLLRAEKALAKMPLLQRGQRLSVQPVSQSEFAHILKLGEQMAGA